MHVTGVGRLKKLLLKINDIVQHCRQNTIDCKPLNRLISYTILQGYKLLDDSPKKWSNT